MESSSNWFDEVRKQELIAQMRETHVRHEVYDTITGPLEHLGALTVFKDAITTIEGDRVATYISVNSYTLRVDFMEGLHVPDDTLVGYVDGFSYLSVSNGHPNQRPGITIIGTNPDTHEEIDLALFFDPYTKYIYRTPADVDDENYGELGERLSNDEMIALSGVIAAAVDRLKTTSILIYGEQE